MHASCSTSCETRTCNRRGPAPGFTLLEVLVAITILGIILITVYGTVSRVIFAKEYAEAQTQMSSAGREAVMRVADEIEGALSPLNATNAVFQGVSSGGERFNDQLRFAIVSRPPYGPIGGAGGRVVVTYSLDQVEGEEAVFIMRRDEAPMPAVGDEDETDAEGTDDGRRPMATLVADNVAGLRFRYLDGQTGQWLNDWDTTEHEMLNRLPMAVEVALLLYDASGGLHDFATIVDLPLAGRPTPTPGR